MRSFRNSDSFFVSIFVLLSAFNSFTSFLLTLKTKLMVRIRNLLVCLVLVISQSDVSAQLIRKNHREMTPSEKTTYVQALIANLSYLWGEASHHNLHGPTEVHTGNPPINGTQFLSWHRLFALEVEDKLRSTTTVANADRITIPYWDWRTENDMTGISWDDVGFLDIDVLNAAAFNLLRGSMSGPDVADLLATSTDVANLQQNFTTFISSQFTNANPQATTFSKRLENYHNRGHLFIGGSMIGGYAPIEPAFFLHHGFVDKLWQDWEDKENAVKSSFPTPPANINDWPGTHPNTITDARHMEVNLNGDNFSFTRGFEVRYAFNKKLLLDGLNGDFSTSSSSGGKKTYCYVAWNGSIVEGTIYAGDVQRDANDNVIADTKGGFVVDGAGADFFAGNKIELRPGFRTVLGAPFLAKIVDKPCGYTTNNLIGNGGTVETQSSLVTSNSKLLIGQGKVYPNPVGDMLTVEYNLEEDSPLSIEVVNPFGQLVWQKSYGTQAKGLFSTSLLTQDLSNGLYNVIVKTAKSKIAMKIVK
jgi:tyrosinase